MRSRVTCTIFGALAEHCVAGFRVGADLNLHLLTLSITSGGETTRWAPEPDDGTEGSGA
jgi:hypothetical protein